MCHGKSHQKFCKKKNKKQKTMSQCDVKEQYTEEQKKISMTDSALDKKETHKYHVLTEENSKTFALEWKKPPRIVLSLFALQIAVSKASVHMAT
jgi:hypothetical protein